MEEKKMKRYKKLFPCYVKSFKRSILLNASDFELYHKIVSKPKKLSYHFINHHSLLIKFIITSNCQFFTLHKSDKNSNFTKLNSHVFYSFNSYIQIYALLYFHIFYFLPYQIKCALKIYSHNLITNEHKIWTTFYHS